MRGWRLELIHRQNVCGTLASRAALLYGDRRAAIFPSKSPRLSGINMCVCRPTTPPSLSRAVDGLPLEIGNHKYTRGWKKLTPSRYSAVRAPSIAVSRSIGYQSRKSHKRRL